MDQLTGLGIAGTLLGLLIKGTRRALCLERWTLPAPFGQVPDVRAGAALRPHWHAYGPGESPSRWGPPA